IVIERQQPLRIALGDVLPVFRHLGGKRDARDLAGTVTLDSPLAVLVLMLPTAVGKLPASLLGGRLIADISGKCAPHNGSGLRVGGGVDPNRIIELREPLGA